MNKKILILSRSDQRTDFDTAFSMAKQLNVQALDGVTFTPCFLEDLIFYFDGQKLAVIDTTNNCDISDYDACFMIGWFKKRKFEDVAHSAGLYMQKHGKKVLNTEVLHNRSRSKLSQLVQASLNGVNITQFLAVNGSEKIDSYLYKTNLEFPLIVKSATASRGGHNFLVNNFQELNDALSSISSKIALIQTFVPNNGDLRVIVMGEQVRMVIKRTSQTSSHLNNTSQGGSAEIMDVASVNPEILKQSVHMAKLLGRDITGIDIIQDSDTGNFYLLEVNNMPQLSTGSFVNEKSKVLSEYLRDWVQS